MHLSTVKPTCIRDKQNAEVVSTYNTKLRTMSFQETVSEIFWSQPKLFAKSNVKNLQLFFIHVYAAQNAWEMFLILKNFWCIADFEGLPPPEYEIPPGGSEMEMWKKECAFAWRRCEYHFLLEVYDLSMNSYKIFTGYHPAIWSSAGRLSTAMLPRALWFVTIDHVITYLGRFFFNLFIGVLRAARNGVPVQRELYLIANTTEENVDHINNFRDMLWVVIVSEVFGLTGVAWLAMLNQLLDVLFFQKMKFETSCSQITTAELPGCKESIEYANQMGFFKRNLLLEVGDDTPRATHYNFITSDLIVITKSLLEKLPPNHSKAVIGHAMIHWKAGYCYWDHLGRLFFLCAKLYICAVVQGFPSLFNIEGEVHPAVMHALAYKVVFPIFDGIAFGIAGWVHANQVLNCDKSIEDAFSSLVYLKKALVQMAILRGSHKFDGWYSPWFFGEPSLINRITKIRRRNS